MRKEVNPLEIGARYGRLVILAKDEEWSEFQHASYYKVRCDCGIEFSAIKYRLRNGKCRSCGCIRKEKARALGVLHPRHNKKQII